MMRTFIAIFLISASALAQSPSPLPREVPVKLQYVNGQLSDLVKLYQFLTKRKVWLDAEVRWDRKISLTSDGLISSAEALRLLREALLKEGVEIREVGESEAYVSRVAP